MKKTVILLAIVVLWAVGAQGQRFDWAKGYGSSMQESGCRIQGSITDSAGNLYILGQYRFDSRWDDEYLRPSEPPYFDVGSLNLLIAKITPDGTMAWKKVVQGSDQNATSHAYDIKPLGDTGFAVMFQARNSVPGSDDYIYWLDSLHFTDRYPLNPYQYADRRFSDGVVTAWLAFDFDGNVKEQYIIQLSGVDTGGNDIMTQPYPHQPDSLSWLVMKPLQRPSFDVDSEGNIYICRDSYDKIGVSGHYYCSGDSLAAIKVWVNHREVGIFSVEDKPTWVPHLLKFAPHFDTLLNSRYVIQSGNGNYGSYNHIRVDSAGNTYLIINQLPGTNFSNTLIFDSVKGLQYSHSAKNWVISNLIIYDSDFKANGMISLYDSIINENADCSIFLFFHGISFDNDSNLFFVTATTGRSSFGDTNHYCSILQYRDLTLNLKSDAFFLSFKKNTYPPELYSYGRVPAINKSEISPESYTIKEKPAIGKNRIFLQNKFAGGIKLPNQNIDYSNIYTEGFGFVILDYQGHIIGGEDYNTTGNDNHTCGISLKDSILYLIPSLRHDADFGEHHVYAAGYDPFVCIAKYVDTSFMTPYVYVPDDSVHISHAAKQDIMVYPNPAESRLHITTHEPLLAATAISVSGVREPLPFRGATIDISPLPAGIYILEITTPTNKYHHKIIKP